MNNNLISVIIPCFNSEKTIERAISSILQQTHTNFEIICIDDCSSDNSLLILKELSEKLNNFTLLVNTINSGPSYSRNRGVRASKGLYIAFLDSDDYWHPQLLELQFNTLITKNYDLISSKKIMNLKVESYISPSKLDVKNITFTKMLIKNQFTTSSVLMRKKIFNNFDESQKYSEDYKLWLEITSDKSNKTAVINSPALVGADKNAYGISGLSSHLWKMEKNELCNYYQFLKKGKMLTLIFIPFSLLKFIIRLNITFFRGFKKN